MTDSPASDVVTDFAHEAGIHALEHARDLGVYVTVHHASAVELLKERTELLELVSAILAQRAHCFIPNDVPGLNGWDSRAQDALEKARG